jgi:hypothetical protein
VPKHRYAAGLAASKPAIPFVLTQGDRMLCLRFLSVKTFLIKRTGVFVVDVSENWVTNFAWRWNQKARIGRAFWVVGEFSGTRSTALQLTQVSPS